MMYMYFVHVCDLKFPMFVCELLRCAEFERQTKGLHDGESESKELDDENLPTVVLIPAGMCLEKRAFYRVISGLHSSINIHLSAEHVVTSEYIYTQHIYNAATSY